MFSNFDLGPPAGGFGMMGGHPGGFGMMGGHPGHAHHGHHGHAHHGHPGHAHAPSMFSPPAGPSTPGDLYALPADSARREPRRSIAERPPDVNAYETLAYDVDDTAVAHLQAVLAAKERELRDVRRETAQATAGLERQLREARNALIAKSQQAAKLESALQLRGVPVSQKFEKKPVASRVAKHMKARPVAGPNFAHKGGRPAVPHDPVKGDDIDYRLADVYNETTSQIEMRRVNKGYYIFGTVPVSLTMINHKLMARTDTEWNRGTFGPIEKFFNSHETAERAKAGLPLD